MFNLGDRVEYVGYDLSNTISEDRMFGTIVAKKSGRWGNKNDYTYTIYFDKRYHHDLHDCSTTKEYSKILEEYYMYDSDYEEYVLKHDRGWFAGAENIIVIKKGNTSIFRRVNNV